MNPTEETLVKLEKDFWQAIVDQDADSAISLMTEPSTVVGARGAMRVDHARYRELAETGPVVLKRFELSDFVVSFPLDTLAVVTYRAQQVVAPRDGGSSKTQEMNDSSTWIRDGESWKCVLHTETPAEAAARPRASKARPKAGAGRDL